ncbi:MAG: C25 family peptidase propeptide domain-containing protein, partial [Candidatus Promineifilaceae bacterium]
MQAQAGQTAVNSSRSFPLIDKLIQSDNGLSFVLNTAVLQPVANGTVQVDGLTQVVQTPGAPMLPYYSAFIAVPPEAEVSVQVTALQATTRAVPALAAAPDLTLVFDNADDNGLFPAAAAETAPPSAAPDPAIYGQDALYPTAVYELSDPMYYRDVRLVQLKLYPVRYNPA